VRALLCVALLLALAGSAAGADSPLFRRADGSAIVFPGTVRAWCGAKRLNVFSVAQRIRQSRWQLQIARKHLQPGRVVRFSWRHENGILTFVYDAKTHNEASQGAENSHATITLRRVSCRLGHAVEIGLSGTIASEFSDGRPVRVSGTYRGSGSARDPVRGLRARRPRRCAP
jgi:hypothetical protein